jgi:hypothetical protein
MSVAGTALHRLPLSSVQEDSSPPRCNQLPVSLTTQLDDQLSGRSLGPWPATAQRRCNGSDRLPRLRHRQRSVDCTARSTSPLPRNLYWTAAGEVVYCPVFFSVLFVWFSWCLWFLRFLLVALRMHEQTNEKEGRGPAGAAESSLRLTFTTKTRTKQKPKRKGGEGEH